MPADNAADGSGVNAEPSQAGTQPAPPPSETPAATPSNKSTMQGVMEHLGIPADVQEQISGGADDAHRAPLQGEGEDTTTDDTDSTDTEESVEAEGTDDAAENLHDEPDGSPFKDPRVQKRLGKIARQKRELAEANAALEAEIADLRNGAQPAEEQATRLPLQVQQQPQGTGRGPLGYVANEQQLNQEVGTAQVVLDWCDANPDGVETQNEQGASSFVPPEKIAALKRDASRRLIAAPDRRIQLRDEANVRGRVQQFARQIAPEVFTKDTQDYQVAQMVRQQFPGIANSPEGDLIVSRYVLGMKAEAEVMKRHQKSDGSSQYSSDLDPRLTREHQRTHIPPLAPHTPKPPTRTATPSATARQKDAMQEVIDSGGTTESLANAIGALRHGSNGPKARELAAV